MQSPRSLWLLGFALGLLYLVRPQEVTIALPLLLLLWPIVKQPPRRWVGWAAAGAGTMIGLMVVQAWVHSHLSGAWTLNAYASSGLEFHWRDPAFWTVLVSPARGLLWLSPIVGLAMIGFATTCARDLPRSFAVFAVQGLIQTYLIASWSFPAQGDAFGARMWSECAGAVACGVGLLYVRRVAVARLFVLAATGACVLWTNRLLVLYVSGKLRVGMTYTECLRLMLGLSVR